MASTGGDTGDKAPPVCVSILRTGICIWGDNCWACRQNAAVATQSTPAEEDHTKNNVFGNVPDNAASDFEKEIAAKLLAIEKVPDRVAPELESNCPAELPAGENVPAKAASDLKDNSPAVQDAPDKPGAGSEQNLAAKLLAAHAVETVEKQQKKLQSFEKNHVAKIIQANEEKARAEALAKGIERERGLDLSAAMEAAMSEHFTPPPGMTASESLVFMQLKSAALQKQKQQLEASSSSRPAASPRYESIRGPDGTIRLKPHGAPLGAGSTMRVSPELLEAYNTKMMQSGDSSSSSAPFVKASAPPQGKGYGKGYGKGKFFPDPLHPMAVMAQAFSMFEGWQSGDGWGFGDSWGGTWDWELAKKAGWKDKQDWEGALVVKGDWECGKCGEYVWASKSNCYKCGAPKGEGGKEIDPSAVKNKAGEEIESSGVKNMHGFCIVDPSLRATREPPVLPKYDPPVMPKAFGMNQAAFSIGSSPPESSLSTGSQQVSSPSTANDPEAPPGLEGLNNVLPLPGPLSSFLSLQQEEEPPAPVPAPTQLVHKAPTTQSVGEAIAKMQALKAAASGPELPVTAKATAHKQPLHVASSRDAASSEGSESQQPQQPQQPQEEDVALNSRGMPLRPDKPYCGYFLKFNQCRFGRECRLHHPEHLGGLGPLPGMGDGALLTEENLPLRPGKEPCPFFMKAGTCHFGPACRFDHSVRKGDEVEAPKLEKKEAAPSKRKAAGLGGTKSKRPPASTVPIFH